MAYCYIIFSPSLNKFYVGACHHDLVLRIENHNNGNYRLSYTSQVSDWQLFLTFNAEDFAHAIRMERKIKSMKSRKYIVNLAKYDALRMKLIESQKSVKSS